MKNSMEFGAFRLESERKRGFSKRRSGLSGGLGVAIKLGVCAACAVAVFAIKLINDKAAEATATAENSAPSESADDELDERLGKLRFVSLPGIIEVFAQAKRYKPMLEADVSRYADSGMLRLTVSADAGATATFDCTVVETGEDVSLGRFVTLRTDKVDIALYGLDELSVECGQPLSLGDTLGMAKEGGSLFIEVRLDGRTVDAEEYFEVTVSS